MHKYAIALLFFIFANAFAIEVPLRFTDVEILNDTYLPAGLINTNEDTRTSNEALQTEVTHFACDCGPHGNCFLWWTKKACSCFTRYAAKLVDSDLKCEPCDCGPLERTCTFDDDNIKLCTCKYGASPYNESCLPCDCGSGSNSCSFNEKGIKECDCRTGYEELYFECRDIDECKEPSLNKCPMETDCFNTIGDYKCICKKGFQTNYPSSKCEDIDECARSVNTCNYISEDCLNTYGSYRCYCKNGYTFDTIIGVCKMNRRGWRSGYIVLIVIIVIAILGTVMYAKRRHFMQ